MCLFCLHFVFYPCLVCIETATIWYLDVQKCVHSSLGALLSLPGSWWIPSSGTEAGIQLERNACLSPAEVLLVIRQDRQLLGPRVSRGPPGGDKLIYYLIRPPIASFLGGLRKPENLKEAHVEIGRTCKDSVPSSDSTRVEMAALPSHIVLRLWEFHIGCLNIDIFNNYSIFIQSSDDATSNR